MHAVQQRKIPKLLWSAALVLHANGFTKKQVAVIVDVGDNALYKQFQRKYPRSRTEQSLVESEAVETEAEGTDEEDDHDLSSFDFFDTPHDAQPLDTALEQASIPQAPQPAPTLPILEPAPIVDAVQAPPRAQAFQSPPSVQTQQPISFMQALELTQPRIQALDPTQPSQHLGRRDSHIETLFFPDKKLPCMQYMYEGRCTNEYCKRTHSGDSSCTKLIGYIEKAKSTLCVCVYTITQWEVNPEQPYLHLLLCSSILCLTVILM